MYQYREAGRAATIVHSPQGASVVRIRSIIILTTGAAGAAAALVASPGTYEWLRRATGRASDRHHYETDVTEHEFADGELQEEPAAETDDLRMSLRARLAESAGDVEAANSEASTGGGVAEDVDEIAASRARVRAKAREARAKISDAE
jgi:hypothetical protein